MPWTPPPDRITLEIEFPKPKAFTLDPAKTLLCIVDMENYFCKTGNERSHDVIEGNVTLLAKARAAGATVVFIQSLRSPDAPEYVIWDRPRNLLEGTWNVEIVEELTPLPGETVVQKRNHDPFTHTRLDEVLAEKGIVPGEWTVLVTGVSAAVCARACALGFSHRDFMTLVPMDCTAASLEMEAITYHHYLSPGYAYDMDFTLSDLVTFAPAVAADERTLVEATAGD